MKSGFLFCIGLLLLPACNTPNPVVPPPAPPGPGFTISTDPTPTGFKIARGASQPLKVKVAITGKDVAKVRVFFDVTYSDVQITPSEASLTQNGEATFAVTVAANKQQTDAPSFRVYAQDYDRNGNIGDDRADYIPVFKWTLP